MRENAIKRSIMKWLRARPDRVWCVKLTGANGAGKPDVIACVNGQFVAMEIKQPGESATKLQARELRMIQHVRGSALVVESLRDVRMVVAFIEEMSAGVVPVVARKMREHGNDRWVSTV